MRRVIGPERDLLIDVHSHYNLERGRDLTRRFETLNLFWLEEVTPAQPIEWLATINREAKMPTAGGETIYGVRGFYSYIAAGAVAIVMPDVKYCGGLLELKKIAALAEGAGLRRQGNLGCARCPSSRTPDRRHVCLQLRMRS